jgi:DNA replication protein DnaC
MLRAADPCPYGRCDGSGFVDDEVTLTARPCRCRPERMAGRRSSALSAVMPKKYEGVGFDRPPTPAIAERASGVVRTVRAFVRELEANLDAGRGLWLFGGPGTGKTTLAMIVSKAALDAGRTVAIYSLPRLLAEIRTTFDDDAVHSYTSLLDKLTEVDLLHIDDVGAEKSSDWVLEQLYAIVNARYEEERSVIITTNLTDRDQMVEQIKERTVSRLEEMCEVLPLYGEDARRRVG